MRRREFISLVGGTAAAWPLVARAQQTNRERRIGVLMAFASNDQEGLARARAFEQRLQELGWTEGRNIKIDYRWGDTGTEHSQNAAELVARKPEVLVSDRSFATAALLRETRAIPIVFVRVADPVVQGLITNLARPGGNVTGFMAFEPSMGGKWVELLKEIAPSINRVMLIHNPPSSGRFISSFFGSIEAAARAKNIQVTNTPIDDIEGLEAFISTQGREPNSGLIVPPDGFLTSHRDLVIAGAARHRLPAISGARLFTEAGGLISYGPDSLPLYRDAADYVDRILKGEKPADLPVQAPTRFELVINLKTAKALDLVVPQTLLASADEVIE